MRLVLTVGLPGSGKSTWLKKRKVPALSSDKIRHMLSGDETNQQINRLVFKTLRDLAKARADAGAKVTYIDATALSPWERRVWIRFAQLNNCEIEAIYFDVPVEECKRRNRKRTRVVPDDVIDRMAARMVPPDVEEGFTRVSRASDMPATRTRESGRGSR